MNDKEQYIYETLAAVIERTIKRFWILCIILSVIVLICVGVIVGFVIYERQWDYVETTTQTVEQTTEGENSNNMFVGGDYGETNGKDK